MALWHYIRDMFFRREKPHIATFSERLETLRKLGFAVNSEGASKARVTRDGIGAVVEDRSGDHPHVNKAGYVAGNEIGLLVNGGYQMFWRTPQGTRIPALATHLKALHNFEEDLKEGLGLPSLYNEGLGTTSDLHLYDRVEHRDEGAGHKPWKAPAARA